MPESNSNLTDEQKIDKILTLSINTSEDVKDIKTRLVSVEETVRSHTTSLDKLLTKKKAKDDDNTVSADRFDRLEHWAKQIGTNLGIKLEV